MKHPLTIYVRSVVTDTKDPLKMWKATIMNPRPGELDFVGYGKTEFDAVTSAFAHKEKYDEQAALALGKEKAE